MAKKKVEEISLDSENPDIERPRLSKLIIENFRCIGNKPVEIELDEIVVLVGENNVGKSSILKAYEVVMSHGSKQGKLSIDDFPNAEVDPEKLPEIQLETVIYENTPGDRWIKEIENGEMVVRERWLWNKPGDPKREGWDVDEGSWSDNVPWGAPGVANSRRPQPHRIDAFASPDEQANAIKSLLLSILTDRIKALKTEGEENSYSKLLETVKAFQKTVIKETKSEVEQIESELSTAIKEIFPDYKILFEAMAEDDMDKSIVLFKAGAELLMGPEDGYLSKIEFQGSGARRTLLWNALKIVEENKPGKSNRPHVLLFDEPEICLHPNAIRDACNVLYDLPKKKNWQVMLTTHSPVFVDISRDNTTIINVSRDKAGNINGTTVYRPSKVKLDEEDKKLLKLLNIYDPYVGEFFFGGKVIVVEGDTEYTAFKYIIDQEPENYKDIHIIKARGKAIIVSLIKILNHFGSNYSVLHDCDSPTDKNGNKSGTWTLNEKIKNESKNIEAGFATRILASVPNFEEAYLGKEITSEKPYNCYLNIESEPDFRAKIKQLLDALIDYTQDPPENCVEYDTLANLKLKYDELSS